MRSFINSGQGTIEAAFLLPIILMLILLLIQPAIILYDYCVMKSAAAEACRTLATSSSTDEVEEFVRRRLAAIPQAEVFHRHDGGCSYSIELNGTGLSETSVVIKNYLQPLPLVDLGAKLLNGGGDIEIVAKSAQANQPGWVSS